MSGRLRATLEAVGERLAAKADWRDQVAAVDRHRVEHEIVPTPRPDEYEKFRDCYDQLYPQQAPHTICVRAVTPWVEVVPRAFRGMSR